MKFSKLRMNNSRAIWPMLGAGSVSLLFSAIIVTTCLVQTSQSQYSNDCRSINGKRGTCISLPACPLFSGWLKQRPVVKENLRLLVKYTCYFHISNPRVCCPNENIPDASDQLEVGTRLGGFRPSNSNENRLVFPTTFSFPPSSGDGRNETVRGPVSPENLKSNKWTNKQDRENLSESKSPLSFVPLSFPTERPDRNTKTLQAENELNSPKDLRNHPNFRLIPRLQECSNAIKLDSLLESYGRYPWIALIGVKRRRSLDFEHICAGVVINDRYILSAAHCFARATPKYVRLGEYDLETLIDDGSEYLPQSRREDFKIESYKVHSDFNPATSANDLSLIRLDKPITLNTTFVKAACLPFFREYDIEAKFDLSNSNELEGKAAWVAGWGRHSWDGLYSRGSLSPVLQEGIVDITPHANCKDDNPNLSALNSRFQLCVGGKRSRNSCNSDSGGPLMFPVKVPSRVPKFSEPKFFMVGLLSRGPTGNMCQTTDDEGRSLSTSVFTKTSKYLSWILDNMQE